MFHLRSHPILSGAEPRGQSHYLPEAVSQTDNGFRFHMMVVSRFAGRTGGAGESATGGLGFISDERLVKKIFMSPPSPSRAFSSSTEV
jgi:hypothetical protein